MNENVNVCITPKGDKPVLHFSQYDNERVFTVTVLADDGESAAVLTGLDIEFRIRKTDSHVVTIPPESVSDNVITFKTTDQVCACCGQNIASVVLMKDDMIISTLDILVEIQRDILSGGLPSASDINNLTTQIEQIVPEVIGDDYYNKQEIDDLFAEHTIDPDDYYDKTDVDNLLADKADTAHTYTKTEVNTMMLSKANVNDVYQKSQTYDRTEIDNYLSTKLDAPVEVDVESLPADIVQISDAGNNCPLSALEVAVASGQTESVITRCGLNRIQLDNDANPQKTYFTYTDETPEKIAGTKNNASNMFFYAFEGYVVTGRHYFFQFGQYLINGAASNCRIYLYSDNILGTSIASFEVPSAGYEWTSTYTGRILIGIYGIGGLSSTFEIDKFMVSEGNSAVTFEPFKGEVETISFGSSLTDDGVLDCISGLITLNNDDTIQCDGIELDTVTGLNNIYSYSGTINALSYFTPAAEDFFRLLRLIKR